MDSLRHAHGVYDYDGHNITLMYQAESVGVWEVYEGANYLGTVREAHTGSKEGYGAHPPGQEDVDVEDEATGDWRSAAIFLVATTLDSR